MTHFVDLRILLKRPQHTVTAGGKRKQVIMRQFQVEIPIGKVEDAEAVMDLLVYKLQELFEKLGKNEPLIEPVKGETRVD